MGGWKWKAPDGSTSGLLYEPGNWGDILKNQWLLQMLTYLQETGKSGEMTLLDPFAGMLCYPLAVGARRRMELLQGLQLSAAMTDFFAEDLWPSASLLAVQQMTGTLKSDAFELDTTRRESFESEDNIRLINGECGWEVLQQMTRNYSLILVDPYDILQQWRQWLPIVLQAAQSTPVLLYIYNRAGRSKERLRDYRAFCREMQKSGLLRCIGRVAADAFLPECWHEMALLTPDHVTACPGWENFLQELHKSAETIDQAISSQSVYEKF